MYGMSPLQGGMINLVNKKNLDLLSSRPYSD